MCEKQFIKKKKLYIYINPQHCIVSHRKYVTRRNLGYFYFPGEIVRLNFNKIFPIQWDFYLLLWSRKKWSINTAKLSFWNLEDNDETSVMTQICYNMSYLPSLPYFNGDSLILSQSPFLPYFYAFLSYFQISFKLCSISKIFVVQP